MSLRAFLLAQTLTLIFLLLLCTFCGVAFRKRYQLPVWGFDQKLLQFAWRQYLPLAALLIFLSYLFFDRWFLRIAPAFYPQKFFWALAIPLRSAFLEETIFRLGLVTVGVGALRRLANPLCAVAIVSAFYAWVISHKTLELLDVSWAWDARVAILLGGAFAANALYGWLFVRRGFFHAVVLHFLVALKYPLLSLLG